MNINATTNQNYIATGHLPRNRFDYGVVPILQTQTHGLLHPFWCSYVYPHETWEVDMGAQARMDISQVVPLDQINVDIYWFFVPLRIIDPNFKKLLGDKSPGDTTQYVVPTIKFNGLTGLNGSGFLPNFLGWNVSDATAIGGSGATDPYEEITAYPVRAYWEVFNNFFRSEQVDPEVDVTSLGGDGSVHDVSAVSTGNNRFLFYLAQVNKYHDYFTNAFVSPLRGNEPSITLPDVPVITGSTEIDTTGMNGLLLKNSSNTHPSSARDLFMAATGQVRYSSNTSSETSTNAAIPSNLIAKTSQAGITIQQIAIANALTQLMANKQMYGTRYIEILRGIWKIDVPDYLLDRPEYLGGMRQSLNNLPVLDTTSTNLGTMAGQSATSLRGASWIKSFHEHGVLLGLSATRVAKHIYSQGFNKALFGVRTELDFFAPPLANLGWEAIENREIYNVPGNVANRQAFGYTESWSADLRFYNARTAGAFSTFYADPSNYYADLRSKWSYQDIYTQLPTLSAEWLKESPFNVLRTLTGKLIPGAGTVRYIGSSDTPDYPWFQNPQYMFRYLVHPKVTRPVPAHAYAPSLTSRY